MNYKIIREFKTFSEASSWFRIKGYTHWYTNTIEDPKYALEGLKCYLGVDSDSLASKLSNGTIVIGECKGTYLIFYK